MGDLIVIAVLAAAVILAVRSLWKNHKAGSCAGCSKCSGGCHCSCGCEQQEN